MKTRAEIEAKLAKVESDPQLRLPPATVQESTVSALQQMSLKSYAAALRWVLELPYLRYHGRDDAKEPEHDV